MEQRTEFAFTQWVARLTRLHSRLMAMVAKSEGLSGEDVLDAVQEAFHTFLRMEPSRALVHDDEGSKAMLLTLVRNVSRNARRRHHRARTHEPLESVDEHIDSGVELASLLESANEHLRLRVCVRQLAEMQRSVVTLRVLEELSGEDVAEKLGMRPAHVAVVLYRAKQALMECMCVLDS